MPLDGLRRLETRAKVLEAALSISAQEGYAAVTPDRVGTRSQLTRAGVLACFGSLASFREEVIQIGILIWEQLIPDYRDALGTGLKGLWFDWAAWLCRARHLPTFLDLLPGFAEADRVHPDGVLRDTVLQFWRRREEHVGKRVAEAREERALKAEVDVAALHASLMFAAHQLPLLTRWRQDTERAIEETAWTMWDRIRREMTEPLTEDDAQAAFVVRKNDGLLGGVRLTRQIRYAEAIRRTGTIRSLPEFFDPML